MSQQNHFRAVSAAGDGESAYIKGEGSGEELQYFAYRTNVWRMPSTQRTHGVYDGKIYGRGKEQPLNALGNPFLLCEHP